MGRSPMSAKRKPSPRLALSIRAHASGLGDSAPPCRALPRGLYCMKTDRHPASPCKRIPSACPWSQLDLFAAGLAVFPSLPTKPPAAEGERSERTGAGGCDASEASELDLSLGHFRTRGLHA